MLSDDEMPGAGPIFVENVEEREGTRAAILEAARRAGVKIVIGAGVVAGGADVGKRLPGYVAIYTGQPGTDLTGFYRELKSLGVVNS